MATRTHNNRKTSHATLAHIYNFSFTIVKSNKPLKIYAPTALKNVQTSGCKQKTILPTVHYVSMSLFECVSDPFSISQIIFHSCTERVLDYSVISLPNWQQINNYAINVLKRVKFRIQTKKSHHQFWTVKKEGRKWKRKKIDNNNLKIFFSASVSIFVCVVFRAFFYWRRREQLFI